MADDDQQIRGETSEDTETLLKKRELVRQRLATTLMAVGGVLFAAAIVFWFFRKVNQ